jgi:hypothetical protein
MKSVVFGVAGWGKRVDGMGRIAGLGTVKGLERWCWWLFNPGYWLLNQRREMELECWMMDCWVLRAILLAFVCDFGWTCWWT